MIIVAICKVLAINDKVALIGKVEAILWLDQRHGRNNQWQHINMQRQRKGSQQHRIGTQRQCICEPVVNP